MFSKERLVFDPSDAASQIDNIGAYLRSSDGTLITHSTDGAKERVDVSSGAEHYDGDAYTAGDKGSFALAVDPSGNYAPLKVNAAGELLADVTVTSGSDKVEDSAHTSGDTGTYTLSVRQDVLASSTSANGDYQSFKTNSLGALWVASSSSAPASYDAWLVTANAVVDTAELVVAADLTNRKKVLIQNVGNKAAWLKEANTVSAANGIRLSPGAAIEMELDAGVTIYAISDAAGTDLRVAEFGFTA